VLNQQQTNLIKFKFKFAFQTLETHYSRD